MVALEDVVVDGGLRYNSSNIDRKIARWRRDARRCPLFKGDQRVCYRCCMADGLALSTRPPPVGRQPPPWPPSESEFPSLDASLIQPGPDEEINEDDCGDYEEEDIFRRYLLYSARKKKMWGSLGCFSMKPKTTSLLRRA